MYCCVVAVVEEEDRGSCSGFGGYEEAVVAEMEGEVAECRTRFTSF